MNGLMQTPHVLHTDAPAIRGLHARVFAKIARLREQHEQASAVHSSVWSRLRQAEDDVMTAEARLETYATQGGTRHPDQRYKAPDLEAAVAVAQAERDRLRAEFDRLHPSVGPAHAVIGAIDAVLKAGKLVGTPPISVALPAGDASTWVIDLGTVRATVAALHDAQHAVEAQPVSLGEARARVEGWLDTIAGRVDLAAFAAQFTAPDPQRADRWESPWVAPQAAGLTYSDPTTASPDGVVALVLQTTDLGRRILDALAASYASRPGLSSTDRAAKLEAIRVERRTAETHEEALVLALEASGYPVPRRVDIDPVVVATTMLADDEGTPTRSTRTRAIERPSEGAA